MQRRDQRRTVGWWPVARRPPSRSIGSLLRNRIIDSLRFGRGGQPMLEPPEIDAAVAGSLHARILRMSPSFHGERKTSDFCRRPGPPWRDEISGGDANTRGSATATSAGGPCGPFAGRHRGGYDGRDD